MINSEMYFPSGKKKCMCTQAAYCTFNCRTGNVACYVPGDAIEEEDGAARIRLYCYQQFPAEVWEIEEGELSTIDASAKEQVQPVRQVVAVHTPEPVVVARKGIYADIVEVVIAVYHDDVLKQLCRNNRMSYQKACVMVYKSKDIPLHHRLYTEIMVARDKLKAIVKSRKNKPDSEQRTLRGLLAEVKKLMAEPKKRSKFPAPVPFQQNLTGGGWC